MKEQEARAKGYTYTGITDLGVQGYTYFEEHRTALKKQGYKTATVNERNSKQSRGCPGMAYRVLWVEQRYRDDQRKIELTQMIGAVGARKQRVLEIYNKAVADIDAEAEGFIRELEELNNKTK